MNENVRKVDDEIDVRELLSVVKRHVFLLIAVTLFALVTVSIYSYFKPDVYQATTTIQIQEGSVKAGDADVILSQALGGSSGTIDNESFLFTSHYLASKALETLDIGTRYFTNEKYKEIELYRNAPFVVNTYFLAWNAMGVKMLLKPIDEDRFILEIGQKSIFDAKEIAKKLGVSFADDEDLIQYSAEHEYGEIISTPWFRIKIEKLQNVDQEYSFSIIPNDKMWKFIKYNIQTQLATPSGSILDVTFEDTIPLRAQEIVNAMAEAYTRQEIERKTDEAESTLKFIDQQLSAINEVLKKSQSNLEQFKKGNIVVDITKKASAATDKLSDYQSRLQELEIEKNVLSNLQQYMLNNKDVSGISLGSFVNKDLSKIMSELKNKTIQRKTMLTEFTELHPDVIRVSESIESLRRSVLFTIKNSLSILNQQMQSIRSIIEEYEQSLSALPEQEQKLANLTRTALVNEKVYSYLLEKRAETAILRSSTVSKTRIIDKAEIPHNPVKPNRTLYVVAGLLLGLMAGTMIAFIQEWIANTITGKDDVERLTKIPIFGVIPFVKNKKSTSAVLEAYRALRTNLEFMRTDIAYQTLVVTSMVSGEGKTTVSTNLARILAGTGKKVLLVDLDMRRANLSKFFDLDNEMGISTLLSRKHTIFQVVKQNVQEGVDVMPAGPVPPNPSELIMSEYAKEILAKLRSSYDFIVLDSPPVGLVTDSAILMHRADASLFVMRQNYTKRDFIKQFNKIVSDHKIGHVGIVVNGVDLKSNYGYGNKYGGNKYY